MQKEKGTTRYALSMVTEKVLSQVAKFSDNHFKVEKNIKDETTNVVVKLLNKQERIEELARMLSGSDISKKTYELAEELIGK